MKKFFADMASQIWTFLGLFCAWLVLTGSAKQVVGTATLIATVLWMVTFPLRNHSDE